MPSLRSILMHGYFFEYSSNLSMKTPLTCPDDYFCAADACRDDRREQIYHRMRADNPPIPRAGIERQTAVVK
jgi:hypothetical protein